MGLQRASSSFFALVDDSSRLVIKPARTTILKCPRANFGVIDVHASRSSSANAGERFLPVLTVFFDGF